jgi:hypothetical protein
MRPRSGVANDFSIKQLEFEIHRRRSELILILMMRDLVGPLRIPGLADSANFADRSLLIPIFPVPEIAHKHKVRNC